jgi:hypothetical protein
MIEAAASLSTAAGAHVMMGDFGGAQTCGAARKQAIIVLFRPTSTLLQPATCCIAPYKLDRRQVYFLKEVLA